MLGDITSFIGLKSILDWLSPDIPKPKVEGQEVTRQVPEKGQVVYGEVKHINGQIVRSITENKHKSVPNSISILQVQWSVGAVKSIDAVFLNDSITSNKRFDLDVNPDNYDADMKAKLTALAPKEAGVIFNYPDGGVATDPFLTEYNIDGKGNAYSVVVLFWHEEAMPSEPTITANIKGRKITNLQTDVTEYRNAFPDVIYDYMTMQYGCRIPESAVDKQSFIDELWSYNNVPRWVGDPSNQPLMSCNVVLDGNVDPKVNLTKLRKSCRAVTPYNIATGKYELVIETDRNPEVFEVTPDVVIGDVLYGDTPLSDRANLVKVTYKDKEKKGKEETVVYPEDNSALVAEDGGREYPLELNFECINNAYEALHAAEIALNRSRESQLFKATLNRSAKTMMVGKVYNVTFPDVGLNVAKPFILKKKQIKGSSVVVEMIEHQPSIYPWSEKQEIIYSDTSLDNYADVPAVTNVSFSVPTDGTGQLKVQWTSNESDFRITVDGKLHTETSLTSAILNNIELGSRLISICAVNGLGFMSEWVGFTVNVTKTQEQIIQERMSWVSSPASGATVGATIGTNLGGQFTSANATTFFTTDALGRSVINVDDLFTEKVVVSSTLNAGDLGSGKYKLMISPDGLQIKNNQSDVIFDTTVDAGKYNGELGAGVISSLSMFTQEIQDLLVNEVGAEGTGGSTSYGSLPYNLPTTTSPTPDIPLSLSQANTEPATISLTIKDSGYTTSASNSNYQAPVYEIIVKRGQTEITDVNNRPTVEGTAYNIQEPDGSTWDSGFNIDKIFNFVDNTPDNTGGTVDYNVIIKRVSGSYNAPKMTAYSLSQKVIGGGGGGGSFDPNVSYNWGANQNFTSGLQKNGVNVPNVNEVPSNTGVGATGEWPIDISGGAESANNLQGVTSSQFIRSDVADTATGLVNFTGGLQKGGVDVPNTDEAFTFLGRDGDANDYINQDGYAGGRPFDFNHPPLGHGTMLNYGRSASGDIQFFVADNGEAAIRANSWDGIWSSWGTVAFKNKLANFTGGLQKDSVTVLNQTENDARYLGISAKAADSDLLDGLDSTAYGRYAVAGTWTAQQTFTQTIITSFDGDVIQDEVGNRILHDGGYIVLGNLTKNTRIDGASVLMQDSTGSYTVAAIDKAQEWSAKQTFTDSIDLKGDNKYINFVSATGALDMSILRSGENLQFVEPEQSNRVHFEIKDDTGVNAPYGYWVGGTEIVNASGELQVKSPDSDKLAGKLPDLYQEISAAKSATCSTGWVTILETTSGRASGEAIISDGESGDHSFMHISWYHSYADAGVTVLNVGGHQRRVIGARWLYQLSDKTYGTWKLQVNVTTSSVYYTKLLNVGKAAMFNQTVNHIIPVMENTPATHGVHVSIDSLSSQGGYLAAHNGRFNNIYGRLYGRADDADNADNATYATTAGSWTTARTITFTGDVTGSVTLDGSGNVSTTALVVGNDSHTHDTRYYTKATSDLRYARSDVASQTIDGGTNTELTILSNDDGMSQIRLRGDSQGSGRLYVGQSNTYGGGVEYNGDATVTGAGAGADYTALYRCSAGTYYWTARNQVNSNDWEFRGSVTAPTFIGSLTGNASSATTASNATSLGGYVSTDYLRKAADANISAHYEFQDSKQLRWGNGADYVSYWNGSNMIFMGYGHGASTYFQQEDSGGTNRNCIIIGGSTPYVRLYQGGNERLKTTATGVDVTGELVATGQVRGSSWKSTSARRYKQVERKDGTQDSLNKVVQLGSMGVSIGRFNDGRDNDTHRWFIAEDVASVMPEVVGYKDGQVENLNYQEMIPDAYAAIAAQQQQIEDQKQQIDELKSMVQELLNGK